MNYVDGYLTPVRRDRKDAFQAFSLRIASIYREYGALRIVDCWPDEAAPEASGFHAEEAREALEAVGAPLRDFTIAADAKPGEAVVLSWTEWSSKEARDAGLARALTDPRMQPRPDEEPLFEGRRLIAGGFFVILDE